MNTAAIVLGAALWLVLVIVAGIVADRKRRSVPGRVILTVLFSPLLLILLALGPLEARPEKPPIARIDFVPLFVIAALVVIA